jgi:hypothetical protein
VSLSSLSQCGSDEGVNSIHLHAAPRSTHGPLNTENPYDSVGIIHNLKCEYISGYVTASDSTIEQIWSKVIDGFISYTISSGGTEEYAYEVLETAREYLINLPAGYSPVSSLVNCATTQNISVEEAEFISRIGVAFSEAADSTSLINALLSVETDMNGSSWEAQQDVGRAVMSIAKHSSFFWNATLDYVLWELLIYVVCMDADAYQQARKQGRSEDYAENISVIWSSLAAHGWTPGTHLPDCR